MSAHALAALLERLHPDAEQAGHEYERLRRALVKFFDRRGASPSDECADDVLDRLTCKLQETFVQNISKYMYGIARLVALERQRGPAFRSIDEVPQCTLAVPAPDNDGNHLHECFDRCLAELPEDSRTLLVSYYQGERHAKISNRRRLASLLGLTDNALRSRVQRLRDRLEQRMHACSSPRDRGISGTGRPSLASRLCITDTGLQQPGPALFACD